MSSEPRRPLATPASGHMAATFSRAIALRRYRVRHVHQAAES